MGSQVISSVGFFAMSTNPHAPHAAASASMMPKDDRRYSNDLKHHGSDHGSTLDHSRQYVSQSRQQLPRPPRRWACPDPRRRVPETKLRVRSSSHAHLFRCLGIATSEREASQTVRERSAASERSQACRRGERRRVRPLRPPSRLESVNVSVL